MAEKEVPPAALPTPVPAAEKAASKAPKTTITKHEAVRLALAELGKDVKAPAIQSFLKERFNIDITAGHAKTTRSKILREDKKQKKAGKKPASIKTKAAPEPKAQLSPAKPVLTAANGKPIHLADIQTLKGLVERVGRETLKTLIGVMAK